MSTNYLSALLSAGDVIDRPKKLAPLAEPQPIRPRPVKDPDYAAIRKKVVARFSKTLAYLAK